MAKIISFNNKKNKDNTTTSEAEAPAWSYKDQIRSHRMVIFYRVLLVVILIVAFVVAVIVQANTKTFTMCSVQTSVENHSIQSEKMLPFDGSILSYGKDGAACVDAEGNAVWNITYEMQSPMVSVDGNVVAIGDYGARSIHIMSATGSIGEITTTMPIYKFCVSRAGEIAVVLNDSDITWIYLYDTLGNILAYFKTTMRQSGFPIDVTISSNGKLVGVSYVYVDSGKMKSSIAFYNFGDVGQNETDNYVSGYDYIGTVVPIIRFMDNEYAFAVSDDRLMFYKGAEKPVSQAEHLISEEIRKVFFDEKYVGLVYYSDQADSRYRIEIYNRNGNKVDERNCNIDFKDITICEDTAYVYSESTCLIFRIGGDVRYEGELPKSTYLLLPTKKVTRFTTANSDTIDTVLLN